MVYPLDLTEIILFYDESTVFHSEYSQCFANTNDQCKHGKLFK